MSSNQLQDVYITACGAFLPNEPVSNDEMEEVLGQVGGVPSRYRKHVLASNGIKTRYYARTKEGKQTHLVEEMAVLAVEDALKNRGMSKEDIQMLATSTTVPDTLMPGFAPMVHGRLGGSPMDVLSASGVCAASMAAMKSAWLAVRAGQHENAVSLGAEMSSAVMKASRFEKESNIDEARGSDEASFKYFNADFLRWMLSDGAGAVVLENKPKPGALNLKVEWIEVKSYAHQFPACMYMGTSSTSDLSVGDTYQGFDTFAEAEDAGMFVIRQDTDLLPKGLLASVVEEAKNLRDRGMIVPEEIDHLVPHISSYFFYDKFQKQLEEEGLDIPKEKWFTNLATKGNTGTASVYIMLEEAFNTGRFKDGEKILCMIPESGRFSVSYALFTCVAA